MRDYKQIQEDLEKNKKRFLALNPQLNDKSGIYILYREDNGIKFAYVGQAKHILTRLAQHLDGWQHIDMSLKKRGLYNEVEGGYMVSFKLYDIHELDEAERLWIKYIASKGYQLYNHTSGGQNNGKSGFDNQRPTKGYHDGLAQGRKNLAKELSHIIDTHLEITLKKDTKVSQKALQKFYNLLKGE